MSTFRTELFSPFGGWALLDSGEFNTRKDAFDHAQLYRIEHGHKSKPVRVVEITVHREWDPAEPIEI